MDTIKAFCPTYKNPSIAVTMIVGRAACLFIWGVDWDVSLRLDSLPQTHHIWYIHIIHQGLARHVRAALQSMCTGQAASVSRAWSLPLIEFSGGDCHPSSSPAPRRSSPTECHRTLTVKGVSSASQTHVPPSFHLCLCFHSFSFLACSQNWFFNSLVF